MQKAHWQNEGDNVKLTMPISKIDKENRLVYGWASLDNIDTQGDLVDANASREAFKRFRGNIREMHDPHKAAGRLVDFKEDTYFDPEEEKFYQGIYVTAYVSKGAQDTWEKVLDGTLSGFSIGGNVEEAEPAVDLNGNPYRKVKKYGLTELSLVDNPANQKANVVGLMKSVGSEEVVLTGDLANITVENVFVCNECLGSGHGVHKSSDESLGCPICGNSMIKIGFVESSDPAPKETIKKMVQDHLADREGGVKETMADENTAVEDQQVDTPEENDKEEVTVDEKTEEEAKEANDTVESEEDATEVNVGVSDSLSEAVESLRLLTERLEAHANERGEEVATLQKAVTDLDARFEERLGTLTEKVQSIETRQTEYDTKFEGFSNEVAEVKKSLGGVEKSLEVIDPSTALKKSVDADPSTDRGNSRSDDFWKGSFLTID